MWEHWWIHGAGQPGPQMWENMCGSGSSNVKGEGKRFRSSYGCMRYHARASATVNTTLPPPFETSQQASRAATIEGSSPENVVCDVLGTNPQMWENVGAGASAGCKCGNIG
jgi:hypothetical protein